MGTGICLFFFSQGNLDLSHWDLESQTKICDSDLGAIRLGMVFDYSSTVCSQKSSSDL